MDQIQNDLTLMFAGERIPSGIQEYAATAQELKTKEEIYSAMVVYELLTYDKFVLLKKGKIQDREMGKAKMGIVINHSENIFLLQTRSNSYAFGIDDQGLVRHTEFLP